MPITVLSPFNGEPVKVRDQDAGRAVKDSEGRIFYVLPYEDGSGYYGATTRAGNPKEEQRARELEAKTVQAAGVAKTEVETSLKPPPARRGSPLKPVLLIVILVVIVGAVLYFVDPLGIFGGASQPNAPAIPTPDGAPDTLPPGDPADPADFQ